MPDEKIRDETDGDPSTQYEDTSAYERYGFRVGDNSEISGEDESERPADLLPGADY
ncbi:hypothetical protein [Cohnella pontilimi]|uniref:hypothetical protein n=1 Tax=Cohnella pontilimi TaxID=2564100 RepID=UPI00145F593D|nr:hypothetical protein [Cohnella pontilimi]